MKEILCFGDSNTHGYMPGLGTRYPIDQRWSGLLGKLLGDGYHVVEEGMDGRTTAFEDDLQPWRSALGYIGPCVKTHAPLDLIIIMLGTNDLLQGQRPEQAAGKLKHFLCGIMLERSKILLIAPPPLALGEWVSSPRLIDDAHAFAQCCRVLAEQMHLRFADAGLWHIPLAYDGVHFTEQGHKAFAAGLLDALQ